MFTGISEHLEKYKAKEFIHSPNLDKQLLT